jgi:hypothetical protein
MRIGITALALSLGGCAGSADEDEGASESLCSGSDEAIDPTQLIDDMEDRNASVLMTGDRTGGWWSAGDDTAGATIVPALGEPALPELIPGGRCGSQYAMRVTGQGFADWGAVLGVNLAYDSSGGVFYDGSAYEGISFWARIGDTSTNTMRFAVSDQNSEPKGGKCVEDGGVGKECFDSFGVTINALDTTWKHYEVPFSGLSQRNFGLPADALDTSTLYVVGFNVEPNSVFDLWVDDVAFY